MGLILVYTGNGKGKTTAALGVLLRSLGHGLRSCTVQFLKGKWRTGERMFAERNNLEWSVMGRGFTWESEDTSRDREMARAAWTFAAERILSGEYDLVILDEICYAMQYGYVGCQDVLETLRGRPAGLHVILTGRNAPEALVEAADLVTEMREIKHPYKKGAPAAKGIDF
jgi:cob(I)alamin adenosyltransferase